jgi:hypothetical protein
MKCHKFFDKTFLFENFSSKFNTREYKIHKEKILLEKELTYLPIAQQKIEWDLEQEKFKKFLTDIYEYIKGNQIKRITGPFYNIIEKHIQPLENLLNFYRNNSHVRQFILHDQIQAEIDKYRCRLQKTIELLLNDIKIFIESQDIYNKEDCINKVNSLINFKTLQECSSNNATLASRIYRLLGDIVPRTKKTFIQNCPSTNCRGFLNSSFSCELCKTRVCNKCREIKTQSNDDKHECDPTVLESVQLIQGDTKQCPGCKAPIFKIDGCNQFFCTICKTAFDWKTLKIETGIIHNPHYFEYIRTRDATNNNNNPVVDFCNRQLDNNFTQLLSGLIKNTLVHARLRALIHIKMVFLPTLDRPEQQDDVANQDLHIKYLLGKIDVENFTLVIQQRHKKIEKNRELYNLLFMYIQAHSDLFFNLYDSSCPKKIPVSQKYRNIIEFFQKTNSLDDYLRHHYTKTRTMFQSKIKNDFILTHLKTGPFKTDSLEKLYQASINKLTP